MRYGRKRFGGKLFRPCCDGFFEAVDGYGYSVPFFAEDCHHALPRKPGEKGDEQIVLVWAHCDRCFRFDARREIVEFVGDHLFEHGHQVAIDQFVDTLFYVFGSPGIARWGCHPQVAQLVDGLDAFGDVVVEFFA